MNDLKNFILIEKALDDNEEGPSQTFNPEYSKRYKDFAKKINRVEVMFAEEGSSQQIDEDVQAVNNHIEHIDPITKQPLKNPVRNKHCNHVYGKESVMALLQQNSRLR